MLGPALVLLLVSSASGPYPSAGSIAIILPAPLLMLEIIASFSITRSALVGEEPMILARRNLLEEFFDVFGR